MILKVLSVPSLPQQNCNSRLTIFSRNYSIMLNKFCFFLSLTTGTVIIGVLDVLYGLLVLVVNVEGAITSFKMVTSNYDRERTEHAVNVVYTEDSIFTMQLLFGIYLIIGTLKEKLAFLYACMMLHLALVAYSAFFVAFAFIMMLDKSGSDDIEWSLPNAEQIANEALKIPINMYFMFIIYGRHEELCLKSPGLVQPVIRDNNESDTEEINVD